MKCPQCWYEGDLPCWCEISKQEEEECSPNCSQGSLPIEEEPCEVCRRKEE